MPFIGSYRAKDPFIVDYDCSYVDDYLRITEYYMDIMFDFNILMSNLQWISPVFYSLIIVIIVSVGKIRQKPNSLLFLIYAVFKMLEELAVRIPDKFVVEYPLATKYLFVVLLFIQMSSFFWLAISSYDYMINIRWEFVVFRDSS